MDQKTGERTKLNCDSRRKLQAHHFTTVAFDVEVTLQSQMTRELTIIEFSSLVPTENTTAETAVPLFVARWLAFLPALHTLADHCAARVGSIDSKIGLPQSFRLQRSSLA